MDTSIIGVALPRIQEDLGFSQESLSWVFNVRHDGAGGVGRPEEGGLAAGIVNTSYQVGSALGLTAMTAVAAAFGADALGDPVALTDGFSAPPRA